MDTKQRIRLDLAYDGTFFHGWAKQPGLRTVEGELTQALSTIWQCEIPVTVAGRTDAGVHAAGQVAHFEVLAEQWAEVERHEGQAAGRIQGLLGRQFAAFTGQQSLLRAFGKQAFQGQIPDVVVDQAKPVSSDFDARFSATGRRYCYRLGDAETKLDPRRRTDVYYLPRTRLALNPIQETVAQLLGLHDFLSFCRPREGSTTIRSLRDIQVRRNSDGIIEFHLAADAFCHSMVRSLVGALVEVGRGKRGEDWVRLLLREPCRKHGVPIIGARGLTLEEVEYPAPEIWARRALESRTKRHSE